MYYILHINRDNNMCIIYIYIYTYTCIHTCMRVYMYVIRVFACMYIYIYTCTMYVCIYIYIYLFVYLERLGRLTSNGI